MTDHELLVAIRRIVRGEVDRALHSGPRSAIGIGDRSKEDPACERSERAPRTGSLTLDLPGEVREGGFLYFAETNAPNGAIKIGIAKNLKNRLSSLRNGCPYELWIAAWYWIADPLVEEARRHDQFRELHLRGEWFAPSEALRSLVDQIADLRRGAVAAALGVR